ncbi:FecR family protein [Tumidithrix elongata]|uniref:FecR family protein n=1 Tax=Tumidithrix elongata TaxID=3088357 RepID=UPI002ED1A4DA
MVAIPGCFAPPPSKPFSSEIVPTDKLAEISEIRDFSVRVRFLNSSEDRPASVGTTLKAGETVRTEGTSRAQIVLNSGVIVRVDGDTNLTINPKNQLNLDKGRLLAWVASSQNLTAEVQTPFGSVSSSDGTFYVNVPKESSKQRQILALNGTVTVKLARSSDTVTLKAGEELIVMPDGNASIPKPLAKEDIEKRLAGNPLIFGFNTRLASQADIESTFKISSGIKEAEAVKFKRSDISKIKPELNPSAKSTGSNRDADRNDTTASRNDSQNSNSQNTTKPTQEPTTAARDPSPPSSSVPSTSPPVATPVTNPVTRTPTDPPPSATVQPLDPPPLPIQPEIVPIPQPVTPVVPVAPSSDPKRP